MRVVLRKLLESRDYDITNLLTRYSWSGSIEQGVRSFSFDILNAPEDKNISSLIPPINIGDLIWFFTDSTDYVPDYLCFVGRIYGTNKGNEKGSINYSCLDFLNNLCKSEANKTFETTAEGIATSLIGEFSLQAGIITPTGVNIGTQVFEEKTYYEMIVESYKKASKSTGIKYYVSMEGAYVMVLPEGYTHVPLKIEEGKNIITSSFSESITDMVNRVKVYDSDNKFLTQVENTIDIQKYGLFEKIYTKTDDEDMTTGATLELKTVEKDIKFTVLGHQSYWSGRSVDVVDPVTNLNGKFIITNDLHTWVDGKYTTQLELKFLEVA